MYRSVPCILILGGFFIKRAKKMCICDFVKDCTGTFKNLCFDVKKEYKRISAPDSCKTYCLPDTFIVLSSFFKDVARSIVDFVI